MAPPALTADEIDDVLYFTRVNEADDLKTTIAELAQKYQCQPGEVLEAAVDPDNGNSTLHYCAANGLADLLPLLTTQTPNLTNKPNAQGSTPLHWAAVNGHLAVTKLLVSSGADVWAKNAAGHLAMFEAERADKSEVVQFLLEAGGKEVERAGVEQAGASEEDERDMEKEVREEEVGDGSGDVKMSMGDVS